MALSVFDMFSIGIGPSSSHTVGPMKAAQRFATTLVNDVLPNARDTQLRVIAELYGSLAATGEGHGTGPAVLLGLEGHDPTSIDPSVIIPRAKEIAQQQSIQLCGHTTLPFNPTSDLLFHRRKNLPLHANAMTLSLIGDQERPIFSRTYYSVGGGFVATEKADGSLDISEDQTELPYPFNNSKSLLAQCQQHSLRISELMRANERAWRNDSQIDAQAMQLWKVMKECVQNGLKQHGLLPGGLNVKRRAPSLYEGLIQREGMQLITPGLTAMDWVNVFSLAVSEENAAGGRMVTAPTNGAAGIIPSVMHYYQKFCPNSKEQDSIDFLLASGAIGILFKKNASISGAEVGCQGEVGSACAMAAAGLTEVLGGTPEQVENAAEIALEHNLGLTCDPVGGLVQVPCIERNAMAAMKAINATSMALRGDGEHTISLDKAIHTMRETGKDMLDKYKETSRGGLAVNIIEC